MRASATLRYFPLTAAAFVSASVCAQDRPAKPHFEVASVKPAANSDPFPRMPPEMRQRMLNSRKPGLIPTPDPGRVRVKEWTLIEMIAAAYRVLPAQVSGPAWLTNPSQFFDVDATIPEGTPKEQVNVMLQTLLEERFRLQAHRETQTKPGFALMVGKNGPKLTPAASDTDPSLSLSPEESRAKMQKNMADMMERSKQSRNNGMPMAGFSFATWPSTTTREIAAHLVGFVGAPVEDQTGLTGKYDVRIETWKAEGDNPGVTIFDAVEKLGLKLESRKVSVDFVVVDQASKMPTEN